MTQTDITPTIYVPTPSEAKLLATLEKGNTYTSITKLCEDAGVGRDAWYDALKKEDFVGALIGNSKTTIYATFPSIIEKIAKQASMGSFPQQKMILEMLNVYQDTTGRTEEKHLHLHLSKEDYLWGIEDMVKKDILTKEEIMGRLNG